MGECMSATYTGLVDMDFVMGDDVTWTVTASAASITDLATWTIRLTFTSLTDGTTFSKTEADTDWIGSVSLLTFAVLVDSTPTSINTAGDTYTVKCSLEKSLTRHHLGSAQWKFSLPPGGAYADI
jgi:hypothetical protein